MHIIKAENGGFIVCDSDSGDYLAAMSTVADLCEWITARHTTTKVEDVTPPNWQVNKYESQPPFLNGTEIVVIWQDGTETYSQPFTVFSRDWDKVAMWRITKGLPYMPTEPAWDKAPDGWIEWKGGECPVHRKTCVQVKLFDGTKETGLAQTWSASWLGTVHNPIVAYRVLQP